ncbi:MAG: DUF481 domain-containing protein [Pseudomonadota bacterium]
MKIKLLALCIASSLYHPSVMAEEETQTVERKSQTVSIDESDDWLQLKSGEVIKFNFLIERVCFFLDRANQFSFDHFTRFEYELTDDIDLSHTYNLNWASNDAGGTRHTNELGFDIDLVDDLELSIKAVWDHLSETKADAEGVVPEKDDYKFHFGLTYEL